MIHVHICCNNEDPAGLNFRICCRNCGSLSPAILPRRSSALLSPLFGLAFVSSFASSPLSSPMRSLLPVLWLASCAAVALASVAVHAADPSPSYRPRDRLLFSDEFDELNLEVWEHELTLGGGGNWEFQVRAQQQPCDPSQPQRPLDCATPTPNRQNHRADRFTQLERRCAQ